jgi:hypothetical protein
VTFVPSWHGGIGTLCLIPLPETYLPPRLVLELAPDLAARYLFDITLRSRSVSGFRFTVNSWVITFVKPFVNQHQTFSFSSFSDGRNRSISRRFWLD